MTINPEETNDHGEQGQLVIVDPQAVARTSKTLGIWATVCSGVALFALNIFMQFLAIAGVVVGVMGLLKAKQAAEGGTDPSTGRTLSIIGVAAGAFTILYAVKDLIGRLIYYL